MNQVEIKQFRRNVSAGNGSVFTHAEVTRFVAQAKRQRAVAATRFIGEFLGTLGKAVAKVRGIAIECTAARRRAAQG